MTESCQRYAVVLATLCLFLLLWFPGASVAEQPGDGVGVSAVAMQQLQQRNVELERQVRRLTQQVAAQRAELSQPGFSQIVAGIGYIVGVFGLVGWWAARKRTLKGSV